jgi:hypothetical protein
MSWLQPWMWASAIAVALPIAVHLISQRPPRATPFPSLRFLTSTRLRPARHRQPSDWPLLLLRIAIVLAAVAAMAQPVWRTRVAPASLSRVIVVDTSERADTAMTAVSDSVAGRETGRETGARLVVPTSSVRTVLPGVVAWLRTQPAPRELVVQSAFRRGALDNTDFAALPADVRVRLLPHTAMPRTVDLRGASPVMLAAAGHDSLATWLTRVQPLPTVPAMRWMAERVAMLQRDSLLVSVAWATTLRDTMISAPVQVVATTATGAPAVLAAVLTRDGAPRLFLWTRTDSTSRVASALRSVMAALPRNAVTDTAAVATVTAVAVSPDTVRAWAAAPAAAPIGAGTGTERESLTTPTDARWLWLLVLVLLGAETVVRRRG